MLLATVGHNANGGPKCQWHGEISRPLSIWIFVLPKSDVYEKDTDFYVDSPQIVRFAIQWNPIKESAVKSVRKNHFSPGFHSVSMGFHRIANWRVRDESAHKSASFSYTSLSGNQISKYLIAQIIFYVIDILAPRCHYNPHYRTCWHCCPKHI